MKFKNMKIEITDEVQLKAVCDVLQSMGYVPNMIEDNIKTYSVITYESGAYSNWNKFDSGFFRYKNTTLTDLLAMRDHLFMEYLK